MKVAQHKIVNLLKHYEIFLCLCVAISCEINVHVLSLFVHMRGFSFTDVCGFQCVVFQAQTVGLTPSDVTCARGDLVRQRLSVIFQPTIAMLGV